MKRDLLSLVLVIVTSLTLSACSLSSRPKPTYLSSIRGALPGTKSVEMTISRRELQEALTKTDLNKQVRIVQIFKSASDLGEGLPEYRLFGITPKSAYAVLGVKNADVVVAAHDYVLKNPAAFRDYVGLVGNEKESSLEIRRDGVPTLIKYRFVE